LAGETHTNRQTKRDTRCCHPKIDLSGIGQLNHSGGLTIGVLNSQCPLCLRLPDANSNIATRDTHLSEQKFTLLIKLFPSLHAPFAVPPCTIRRSECIS
jgi:hypothetical protein